MANIQFPNIPAYPGVPLLLRQANAAIAAVPVLAIGIGSLANILGNALQQAPRWGIFDADGLQVGVNNNTNASIISAITAQPGARLTTFSFDFVKETRVSDFPIEQGSFASYNKVETPASPVITLSFDGNQDDRAAFLSILNDACLSTELFSVVTPEVTYVNYSIERYTYSRSAAKGATLLMVDVALKEIRQVSAAFAQTMASPIAAPQNAAATAAVNNGKVQAATPDTSVLKQAFNKLGISN